MRWVGSTPPECRSTRTTDVGRGRLLASLVAGVLVASGCDADQDPGARGGPLPTPTVSVSRGGTVRLGVLGEPPTLDPYGRLATATTWALARPLYRSLFRVLPDRTVVPDLAASVEEVAGGVQVTLEDTTWSDGKRVTARDVVRSVERAERPSGFAGLSARPRGLTAVVFRGKAENWERRLATGSFVLPRGRAGRTYSGPFVIARRTPGLKVVLEPNEAWAGDPARLDRIEVQYVTSLRTMMELLAGGRLEAAWLPSSVNLAERLDERAIPYSSALGTEVVSLEMSAAGLDAGERAWVIDRIDLDHLHEGLIRDEGRIAGAAEPQARPRRPEGALRLTIPAGDELLALLAQNLQIQLGPRDPIVEIAVAEPSAVYGGGAGDPGGIKLVRTFGRGPPGSFALFEVDSFVAFTPGLVGVQTNPTIEGPLWNAEAWGLAR
jgi:hypothetical protein